MEALKTVFYTYTAKSSGPCKTSCKPKALSPVHNGEGGRNVSFVNEHQSGRKKTITQ